MGLQSKGFTFWNTLVKCHNLYFEGESSPFPVCDNCFQVSVQLDEQLATVYVGDFNVNYSTVLASKVITMRILVPHPQQLQLPSNRSSNTSFFPSDQACVSEALKKKSSSVVYIMAGSQWVGMPNKCGKYGIKHQIQQCRIYLILKT